MLVPPGTLVKKGDIIARSGGTPGTWGAGQMTTGAHLHFEMFKDGQHINPRRLLPNMYASAE
jgi:murein DD-endopeptidase MepM/ murein hydrolase activator NlpD